MYVNFSIIILIRIIPPIWALPFLSVNQGSIFNLNKEKTWCSVYFVTDFRRNWQKEKCLVLHDCRISTSTICSQYWFYWLIRKMNVPTSRLLLCHNNSLIIISYEFFISFMLSWKLVSILLPQRSYLFILIKYLQLYRGWL